MTVFFFLVLVFFATLDGAGDAEHAERAADGELGGGDLLLLRLFREPVHVHRRTSFAGIASHTHTHAPRTSTRVYKGFKIKIKIK